MSLDWRHRLIRLNSRVARIPGAIAIARKTRNQCDLLIANALTNGRPSGISENGELWLLERLAPVSTFVDVGANLGEWTARVLQLSPAARGLAFEPIPALATRIAGVEVVTAAVGDDTSPPTADFFRHETVSAVSSLFRESSRPSASPISVRVTTLDRELPTHGLAQVDVIKVDAEGYDLHVLRGASDLLRRQAIGVIQFEYSHAWLYARSTLAEAMNLLERCGYVVRLLTAAGLQSYDYARWGEYFAYSNFVAVSPARADLLDPDRRV